MRAEEEQIAQECGVIVQPAFLLQEVQKDNASHHLLHIVVNGGALKALLFQFIDDNVVVAMLFIEELLAEGIDGEGLPEVGQLETAILLRHLSQSL